MLTILKNAQKQITKCIFTIQIKSITKTVTGQKLIPLTEKTLTGRLLIYMNQNNINKDVKMENKHELFKTLKNHPQNIQKFTINNIIAMLAVLNDRIYVQQRNDFKKFFNSIDRECCNRLNKLDTNTILLLLHSYMIGIPNLIVQSDYYKMAVKNSVSKISDLNKDQLVQLIFFIGLLKKSNDARIWLRQCLLLFNDNLVNNLTTEDLCIICNSTFKTSTKITNELLLNKIKSSLYENLSILNDPAFFITFIKTLRHNRYQDSDLLDTITYTMFFNKTIDNYSFSAICHILSLYADYLYYDHPLIEILTKKGLELLKNSQFTIKETYLEDQYRVKDLKRFLWSLSNINSKLDRNDIENTIIPHVKQRINAGEFKREPGILIDIILYLWMMHYRAYDLIKDTLTVENINFIRATSIASKKSINLLLTCIYYEDNELYKSINIEPIKEQNYNVNIQLNKRPELEKIVEHLSKFRNFNGIEKYDVLCQVPFLNIIGIVGYGKGMSQIVNVEVLDNYTCLKNTKDSKIPSGLMQLKLRLLEKMEEGVLVLDEDDISSISETELTQKLKEDVSLIC